MFCAFLLAKNMVVGVLKQLKFDSMNNNNLVIVGIIIIAIVLIVFAVGFSEGVEIAIIVILGLISFNSSLNFE